MTQQRRKYTDKPDSRFTESLNFDERASIVRTTYQAFRREWDICDNHERSIPAGKAHSWKPQMRLSPRKCSFVNLPICHFCRKSSFVASTMCHFYRKDSFVKGINILFPSKRLICESHVGGISMEKPRLCGSQLRHSYGKGSIVKNKHKAYPPVSSICDNSKRSLRMRKMQTVK